MATTRVTSDVNLMSWNQQDIPDACIWLTVSWPIFIHSNCGLSLSSTKSGLFICYIGMFWDYTSAASNGFTVRGQAAAHSPAWTADGGQPLDRSAVWSRGTRRGLWTGGDYWGEFSRYFSTFHDEMLMKEIDIINIIWYKQYNPSLKDRHLCSLTVVYNARGSAADHIEFHTWICARLPRQYRFGPQPSFAMGFEDRSLVAL